MTIKPITNYHLSAKITANGSSFIVCIVQETGEDFMGQQVLKSRSYSTMKTAQRGAIKMLGALL